jgi:serine phosphatase RsbU (regulator of sigma subunit)
LQSFGSIESIQPEVGVVRLVRIALLGAALLITVLAIFGIRDFSRSPYNGIEHHSFVIQGVAPDSPNRVLPLERGDRIVAVNGVRVRNLNHYNDLVGADRSLEPQDFTIARGDSVFTVSVDYTSQPEELVRRRLVFLIVGFTFIFVGFVVAVKRTDILGVLFAINCFIFSFIVTVRPITSVPLLQIGGELVYDFLFIFLPAFFFHFFLLFPGRDIERGTRRSRIIRALYIPPVVLYLCTFVLALENYAAGVGRGVINAFEALTAVYWVGYLLASLATFIRSYATASHVQRVKLTIVILGVALGILPISIGMLVKQFDPTAHLPLSSLSVLFLSFISISFAYAILKHDAFDLGIVFRGSLVYTLLVVFVVALYAVVGAIGGRLGGVIGVRPVVWSAVAIILAAVAVIPARAGVQGVVDRAFRRGRKVFKEEVIAFSRQIQYLLSLEDVSEFVTREIGGLFGAESVHLFLADGSGNYTLRETGSAEERIPLTSFPPGTDLIRLMREGRLPLMLEYFDRLWIRNNLDRISRELLSLSRAAVALPLIEQDELLGFVLLGRKRSGRPYSRSDAEVLELLGERSAVAFMNIRLCRDSIEKERLDEELQVASEIQSRLLPGAPPSLAGAAITAGLRTSREVGGDFYDFVDLGPGRIGIAVADVSGKGIPAALLMTTLQASFRNEALRSKSPGAVVSALNKSLYERSDPEKFATVFYAMYDDEAGTLQYCNAGAYPPFILSAGGRISRLHRGGTLLGVEADIRFEEGVTKLRPGDLLVIYTDGFIDQENENGEPFGEQRLVEFFRNSTQVSFDTMVAKLFATTIAFGQNNIKDDMTVVLLRRDGTKADAPHNAS